MKTTNTWLLCTTLFAIMLSTWPCIVTASPRCEGKLLRSEIDQRQEATLRILRAKDLTQLQTRMDDFLARYVAGTLTDEELFFEFGAFDRWSPALTPIFREWIALYPKSFAAHHAMALHIAAVAWQVRGEKWARETSEQQFDEFHRRLLEARDWSLRSIPLHPKPILSYQQLMTNAKAIRFNASLPGRGLQAPLRHDLSASPDTPRPDVIPILEESFRIDPNNTIVRVAYVTVLSPRWGGSLEALNKYSMSATHTGLPSDRVATVTHAATMEAAADHRMRSVYEVAVELYERAAKICRLNQPYIDIGDIRLGQKRYQETLVAADAALLIVPTSPAGLRLKALALQGLGRHEEAVALLQKIAPGGTPDVVYRLAEYYLSGGGGLKADPAEARRLLSIAARAGSEAAAKRLQGIDASK